MKDWYTGKNLWDIAYEYTVDITKLSEESRNKVMDAYGCDEERYIWMSGDEINDMNVDFDAVDWSDPISILPEFKEDIIKDADHYLCFARGCRWNGASGYKLAKSFEDALSRDYDISLTISRISKGKKALSLVESSHDVPTGSTTVIVALTEKEYNRLQNASFDSVEKFANQYIK